MPPMGRKFPLGKTPHNSRLAELLKTKREDLRDPNQGAHPRVRERAETVWRQKVEGLNHDG